MRVCDPGCHSNVVSQLCILSEVRPLKLYPSPFSLMNQWPSTNQKRPSSLPPLVARTPPSKWVLHKFVLPLFRGRRRRDERFSVLEVRESRGLERKRGNGVGRTVAGECGSLDDDDAKYGNDAGLKWHPFDNSLLWRGTEAEAMQTGSLPASLPPSWKVRPEEVE